jgi:hypothetical protein
LVGSEQRRRFNRKGAKHAKNSLSKTIKHFALFAPLRLFVYAWSALNAKAGMSRL